MKLSRKIIATILAALMAISMMPFSALADDTTDLKNAIDAYETKMDGTIYKNMKAAYDAYVTACAVYYGTNTSVTAAAAASDLTTKTAAMTAYSAYNGTDPVYFGTDAQGAYSNILYANRTAGTAGMANSGDSYSGVGYKDWATDKRTFFKAFAPTNVVMYYNGDLSKLYYPIGIEAYANTNDNNYRTIQWVDLNDDSNIGISSYWNGYQQNWDNTYGIVFNTANTNRGNTDSSGNDANNGTICSLGYNSSNAKAHTLSKDGSSKNRFWVNTAHVTALNSDNTLTKTSLTVRLKITQNKGSNNNITSPGTATVSSNVYVVNYYQVTQAIANNKGKLDDVASYKKGGLATLLAKYDDATSFDITSYFNSANESNAGTCATNAESAAKSVANGVNNCAAPTKDTYTVRFFSNNGVQVNSRNIALGSALGELPSNSAPVHIANTDTHSVYTWGGITAATVVEYDTDYTETATETACTFTAGAHTDATDAENGYTTYSCTCGNSYKSYDTQNFDAYDAAVLKSDSLKVDEYYTEASRTAYAVAVEAAKIDKSDKTLSPKAIADAAAAIEAAESLLVEAPRAKDEYNLSVDDGIEVDFDIDTQFYEAEKVVVEFIETTDENGEITAEKTSKEYPAATTGKTPITLDVAPAQIAEPYTIKVVGANDVVIETIETSIVKYCNDIINGEYDEKDKEVARGILDYGAESEAYFNYRNKTETAGYSVDHSADYEAYAAAINPESLRNGKAKASFKAGVDASGANVTITGISYVTLLNPEFLFYVSQENDVWAALTEVSIEGIDGLEAKMVNTPDGNCIRVTGLNACDFAKPFKITIGTAELTYNGYAFLYTALTSNNVGTSMKNLAKGIYRYVSACEARYA